MDKIVLTGLLPEEITEALALPEKFRGKQIFKWIGSGVEDFDSMTNIGKKYRTRLKTVLRSARLALQKHFPIPMER